MSHYEITNQNIVLKLYWSINENKTDNHNAQGHVNQEALLLCIFNLIGFWWVWDFWARIYIYGRALWGVAQSCVNNFSLKCYIYIFITM